MTALSLILLLIFIIKFFAIVFVAGFFTGLIPFIGEFLSNSVFFVFQLGEKAAISIKSMIRDKSGKNNRK